MCTRILNFFAWYIVDGCTGYSLRINSGHRTGTEMHATSRKSRKAMTVTSERRRIILEKIPRQCSRIIPIWINLVAQPILLQHIHCLVVVSFAL